MEFNEKNFNEIAYSYRSWPVGDPKGVSERYEELLEYVKILIESAKQNELL